MREFSTAAARTATAGTAAAGVVLIRVDEDVFVCRRPADANFVLLVAATSPRSSLPDRAKAVLDFIEQCLLPEGAAAGYSDPDEGVAAGDGRGRDTYRDRLLDTDDGLDLPAAVEHMKHLAEVWGGRPTTSPSGS